MLSAGIGVGGQTGVDGDAGARAASACALLAEGAAKVVARLRLLTFTGMVEQERLGLRLRVLRCLLAKFHSLVSPCT